MLILQAQRGRPVHPSHQDVSSPPRRPSLSQSTDTDGVNQGPRPGLLPKFAISAESEGEETSGLGDPSKTSLSIGELPQDEHDATTPGSTHSGATLSGAKFRSVFFYLNCIAGKCVAAEAIENCSNPQVFLIGV